ncbi:MAG: PQQ-dependent dehydrogenase, methanol/ethanol family [Myxococcota bacterium]|nr:PQQ-dependent dehydrogenase, methanol/ethanol family [Myxococcota bacterium]
MHARTPYRVTAVACAFIVISCLASVAVAADDAATSKGASVDWPFHGLTPHEERHSPLDQINRETVGRLGLAWSFATGSRRGLEATPLVIDGVLYASSTWSKVFALDAATGRELWHYDPKVPREVGRKACCDVVNRGVAHRKGRIYVAALDGRLIALDAGTGAEVWSTQTVPKGGDYTITGAPRVVNDLVVIGNSGGEFGVRGYITAYDAETGKQRWRFYTVPPPPGQPFEHPELEMAAATWSKQSDWASGLGGTAWDSMAHDPELDLLYVGVGNSSPYNREVRSPGGGDNLFLTCILALRPATGELAWYYQTTPAENWDYTATQHMILTDLTIEGRKRKVLMQAPKNGFFYVLDRATGELISAEGIAPMNWASHVDMKTGRPVETGRGNWADQAAYVMPGVAGAHNWHPMSFHPGTGFVYVPTLSNVWPFHADADYAYEPGVMNTGEDWSGFHEALQWILPFCEAAHLTAWDPVAGREVWKIVHDHPINGGVLTTAGGLVFQGNGGGFLAAYDATTGDRLWKIDTGTGVMAPPVTYQIDGHQYIAVLAGIGGSPAMNFANYRNDNAGRIFAFRLDAKDRMPATSPPPARVVSVEPRPLDPAEVTRGRKLFGTHCSRCHGPWARSTGWLPDLRYSSRAVHDGWESIVIGGAYEGKGMASFADQLTADDARALHAFVLDRAFAANSIIERLQAWAADNLCIPAEWMAD